MRIPIFTKLLRILLTVVIAALFLAVCTLYASALSRLADVNIDRTVDVADVTALLDGIAGYNSGYQHDLNKDDECDVNDVTALLNLISKQRSPDVCEHVFDYYTITKQETCCQCEEIERFCPYCNSVITKLDTSHTLKHVFVDGYCKWCGMAIPSACVTFDNVSGAPGETVNVDIYVKAEGIDDDHYLRTWQVCFNRFDSEDNTLSISDDYSVYPSGGFDWSLVTFYGLVGAAADYGYNYGTGEQLKSQSGYKVATISFIIPADAVSGQSIYLDPIVQVLAFEKINESYRYIYSQVDLGGYYLGVATVSGGIISVE